MKIVAITNQKGGVGKTSTVACVGACLAALGQRTLLVDLDVQGNLTHWLLEDPPEGDAAAIFTQGAPIADHVVSAAWPGVDVVPSSAGLMSVEGVDHRTLWAALATVGRRYQWCLIDCPPALGPLTLSAMLAARWLVVPVTGHIMSLEGLGTLVETVEVVRRRGAKVEIGAIVPTRITRTRLARRCVDLLREQFGPLVTETVVRENIRLAESPSWHQPIIEYAPDSNGAADYRAVTDELVRKLR